MNIKHNQPAEISLPVSAMGGMAQGKIQIYNAGPDNTRAGGLSYLTPITLRIGSFVWHGMGSEYTLSHITVSGVRLDEHANENPQF